MATGREWFGRWSVSRDGFALAQSGSLGYYHSFRQRLGHQGLFADRLDAHTAARVIEPGVEAWYQSRSRRYAPELGRFVTADPNGTGVPVQASLAMHGLMASGPPSGSFGWESHYGDGWDVFTAYGANPVVAQDPTGLSIIGLFTAAFTENNLRAGHAGAQGSALAGVQLRISMVLAQRYRHIYAIAEIPLAEFAGIGIMGGGLGLVSSTARLEGHTFRAFTRGNFRENLRILAEYSGRFYDEILDAHHIIPVQFESAAARFRINIHNPIFGQWVDRATHTRIHNSGYNQEWSNFFTRLERSGVQGEDAAEKILQHARKMGEKYGFFIGF